MCACCLASCLLAKLCSGTSPNPRGGATRSRVQRAPTRTPPTDPGIRGCTQSVFVDCCRGNRARSSPPHGSLSSECHPLFP
eukprot:13953-Prymnesium_polylepis.1